MAVATGTAILAGAGIAAGASALGGVMGANAASDAADAQASLAREGFGVYRSEAERSRQFLERQNALAMAELKPFKDIGLQALGQAQQYLDPNSPMVQQERAQYQKTLAQNLSARGLTASGTEIAGLTDFELGQGQQRRSLVQGLAGLGAGFSQSASGLQAQLGQGLAGLYSNLGQAGASIYGALGQGAANSIMAGNQAMTQGLVGVGNAAQGALLGFANANQAQQNQEYQTSLLASLSGRGGSSGYASPLGGNYGGF